MKGKKILTLQNCHTTNPSFFLGAQGQEQTVP